MPDTNLPSSLESWVLSHLAGSLGSWLDRLLRTCLTSSIIMIIMQTTIIVAIHLPDSLSSGSSLQCFLLCLQLALSCHRFNGWVYHLFTWCKFLCLWSLMLICSLSINLFVHILCAHIHTVHYNQCYYGDNWHFDYLKSIKIFYLKLFEFHLKNIKEKNIIFMTTWILWLLKFDYLLKITQKQYQEQFKHEDCVGQGSNHRPSIDYEHFTTWPTAVTTILVWQRNKQQSSQTPRDDKRKCQAH